MEGVVETRAALSSGTYGFGIEWVTAGPIVLLIELPALHYLAYQ